MSVKILQGDCLEVLKTMPDESVNCCVTSPPYLGLRDYGVEGQLGLERKPEEYVAKMVEVFREVRRVLRGDGTLWLNLGDSYASRGGDHALYNANQPNVGAARCHANGSGDKGNRRHAYGLKPKDLIGIPWMIAFALRADGYYLRQDIIWSKPNPMPESVTDRCTKAHEYIFLMSNSQRYFYAAAAIKEKASPDSNARYARGRSENHKWADGGPGNQTIAKSFAHMLKPGVNPKAEKALRGTKQNASFSAAVKDLVEDRNKRSVWTVATAPFPGAHFATFPPKLIEPCILAGCPVGGTVLDPFGGSGTVGMVAENNGRNSILIELNPKYVEMAKRRTSQQGLFGANHGRSKKEAGIYADERNATGTAA